jgi:pyruvate dehydrogenase phosphatase
MDEHIPHAEAICRVAPASSGLCALLALYDPTSSERIVRVACLGASRAVLGRESSVNGKEWE